MHIIEIQKSKSFLNIEIHFSKRFKKRNGILKLFFIHRDGKYNKYSLRNSGKEIHIFLAKEIYEYCFFSTKYFNWNNPYYGNHSAATQYLMSSNSDIDLNWSLVDPGDTLVISFPTYGDYGMISTFDNSGFSTMCLKTNFSTHQKGKQRPFGYEENPIAKKTIFDQVLTLNKEKKSYSKKYYSIEVSGNGLLFAPDWQI